MDKKDIKVGMRVELLGRYSNIPIESKGTVIGFSNDD